MENSEHSLYIKQMLEVEVFPNLSQQVIMTTEDRLKLCLKENIKKAERKHEWVAPLSLLITIVAVLVTASFKDYLLSSKTWEALFILGAIGSTIWLILSLKHALKKIEIDSIIQELKANQKQSTNNQ